MAAQRTDEGAVGVFRLSRFLFDPSNRGDMNGAQHRIKIATNFMRRDAQQTNAVFLHPPVPFPIACRSLFMHSAINLDDQTRRCAEEIRHIRPDRVLSAKLQTGKATIAQFRPEHSFRR